MDKFLLIDLLRLTFLHLLVCGVNVSSYEENILNIAKGKLNQYECNGC